MTEAEIYKLLREHNVSFGSQVVRKHNDGSFLLGVVLRADDDEMVVLQWDNHATVTVYTQTGSISYSWNITYIRNWPDAWNVEKVVEDIKYRLEFKWSFADSWSCKDFAIEEKKEESELERLRKENEELNKTNRSLNKTAQYLEEKIDELIDQRIKAREILA